MTFRPKNFLVNIALLISIPVLIIKIAPSAKIALNKGYARISPSRLSFDDIKTNYDVLKFLRSRYYTFGEVGSLVRVPTILEWSQSGAKASYNWLRWYCDNAKNYLPNKSNIAINRPNLDSINSGINLCAFEKDEYLKLKQSEYVNYMNLAPVANRRGESKILSISFRFIDLPEDSLQSGFREITKNIISGKLVPKSDGVYLVTNTNEYGMTTTITQDEGGGVITDIDFDLSGIDFDF